jgi:hypothetical protein
MKDKDINLIKLGAKTAKDFPSLAGQYFKNAGATQEEIHQAMLMQEAEEKYKKGIEGVRKKRIKKDIKEMYENLLADATKSGDEEKIKLFSGALKIIEKEEQEQEKQ